MVPAVDPFIEHSTAVKSGSSSSSWVLYKKHHILSALRHQRSHHLSAPGHFIPLTTNKQLNLKTAPRRLLEGCVYGVTAETERRGSFLFLEMGCVKGFICSPGWP